MSGFLVKTFLRAYQMASRQMSYYYGQPLVHCYLLHAEWLSSGGPKDLSDAVRARLWEKVVDASIKAASDAQGHLVSMQMPDRRGRGKARGAQSPDRLGSHRSGPKPYAGRPFAHDNHEQA
jgi:hypothetical protein